MAGTVDSHHHLWRYSPEEYAWITDSMPALRRDFLLPDLRAALTSAGVAAAISVQARETLEETAWLLTLARSEPLIAGVVGWAPLAEPGVAGVLDELARDRKLKGVRHVLQDDRASLLMEDTRFNAGVALLARYQLAYDILIFERHLNLAIGFADRHPNQVFVLDHIAKPRIAAGVMEPWRSLVRELARRPNIYCKLSGLVTEADWSGWRPAGLEPYLDVVLEAFGPRRLMFGSDWPVMLVASTYQQWHGTLDQAFARLSEDEREWIWSATARQAYRL